MLPNLNLSERHQEELREWNKKIKLLKDQSVINKANNSKLQIQELTHKVDNLHKPAVGYIQRPSLLHDDREKLTSLRIELNQFLKASIKSLRLR